jgi:hypothetical protein
VVTAVVTLFAPPPYLLVGLASIMVDIANKIRDMLKNFIIYNNLF